METLEAQIVAQRRRDDEEGRTMGRWLHNIVDPKAGNSGVIGYTCDAVAIPKDKTHVCKQHVVRSPDGTVA